MTTAGDLKALLEGLPEKSMAARLTKLMPTIDARIRSGVSHETIVEALEQMGLKVPLTTFRSCLYRWRKANGRTDDSSVQKPKTGAVPKEKSVPDVGAVDRFRNPSDVAKLRTKSYDLDALSEMGKKKEGD